MNMWDGSRWIGGDGTDRTDERINRDDVSVLN